MQEELLLAIYKNDMNSIRSFFTENSVEIPLTTYLHRALHIAVMTNNKELVRCLVKEFLADLNCTDINGWSPLGYIAVEGDPSKYEIAQLLISLGADVDFSNRTSGYFSPLQLAKDNRDCAPQIYDLFTYFTKNTKWARRRSVILCWDACRILII